MSLLKKIYQPFSSLFASRQKSAAVAWQEGGGEATHAYWLYVAPVNLLMGRDSFFLAEPAPLSVSKEEARSLINSLNQHFSQDGYHFYLQGNDWFLGLDADPSIVTTPVNQVIGKDISAYLPQGSGALAWAAWQNEMQMLLFSHPINQAREARQLPIVNSLWCYGLGKLN